MVCVLHLLALVASVSYALPIPDTTQRAVLQEWAHFKTKHAKAYRNPIEEFFRRQVWKKNVDKIAEHNLKYYTANITYRLSMNAYGDLLHREFLATHSGTSRRKTNFITDKFSHGLNVSSASTSTNSSWKRPLDLTSDRLPPSVDWRQLGAVTPIKRQGNCGSCWAFAVTGSLEGVNFIRTGKLVSLSEQNLLDCVSNDNSDSCDGGVLDDAYIYVRNNNGIDTESSYPYEGKKGPCRYNPENKAASDVGFHDIPDGDEEALKAAIALVGPVSVGIDASHYNFQFYSDGIYKEDGCVEENLNHGVLVVGYGTSQEGEDYWIIKNSWGTDWGDAGFFYLARNQNNMCGITAEASFPLMK